MRLIALARDVPFPTVGAVPRRFETVSFSWNPILDPKLDKSGWGVSGSDWCESSLIDLLAEHGFFVRSPREVDMVIRLLARLDLIWTEF